MRVRVLQHSAQTPPGSVINWLDLNRHEYRVDKLHEGEPLPSVDDFDWLISLGGEMNCDDDERYPFLAAEKALLKQVLEKKKAILGLCLGGQLLARALGCEVKKHPAGWEVGWHPVQVSTSQRLVVFQWHQDTFELPEGAQRIASNQFCQNQGFIFNDSAVGLQFHPEATEEWISSLCGENPTSAEPFPAGGNVQPAAQIMAEFGYLTPMRKWFFALLDQMDRVARR